MTGAQANQDIRNKIKARGLKQWQVAAEIGISEATIIRWMRQELTVEHKTAILRAIETLCVKKYGKEF